MWQPKAESQGFCLWTLQASGYRRSPRSLLFGRLSWQRRARRFSCVSFTLSPRLIQELPSNQSPGEGGGTLSRCRALFKHTGLTRAPWALRSRDKAWVHGRCLTDRNPDTLHRRLGGSLTRGAASRIACQFEHPSPLFPSFSLGPNKCYEVIEC